MAPLQKKLNIFILLLVHDKLEITQLHIINSRYFKLLCIKGYYTIRISY